MKHLCTTITGGSQARDDLRWRYIFARTARRSARAVRSRCIGSIGGSGFPRRMFVALCEPDADLEQELRIFDRAAQVPIVPHVVGHLVVVMRDVLGPLL